MTKLLKFIPFIILATGCAPDTFEQIYHGGDGRSDPVAEELPPFPIKPGDRLVYMWQLTKRENCNEGNNNEQSMLVYQCLEVKSVNIDQPEVKITAATRFALDFPYNMDAAVFNNLKQVFAASFFYGMMPEAFTDYGQTEDIIYPTQRTPRPYPDSGPDGLYFANSTFIELRNLGTNWAGWDNSSGDNFRQQFSSYFVGTFVNYKAFFQVQRTSPILYEAGYTWRDLAAGQPLHALYTEYDEYGIFTKGQEAILTDNGTEDPLPNAQEAVNQGCKYNNSLVINVSAAYSSLRDEDEYWDYYLKKCGQ